MDNTEYLDTLKKRGKESRVHREYQLIGLEIAEILNDNDPENKAIYIRLAKYQNAHLLRGIAKKVAEAHNVKNKIAYFMSLLPRKISKPKSHGGKNSNH